LCYEDKPILPDSQKCNVNESLLNHNKYRQLHGSVDLVWDETCFEYAKKCVDKCSKLGRSEHCFTKSQHGLRMGQNIHDWSTKDNASISNACRGW